MVVLVTSLILKLEVDMERESEVASVSVKAEASVQSKETPKHRSKTGSVGPVLGFALIVCLGGVLGGYSHGYPSPTLLDLQRAYQSGERVTAFSSSSVYEGIFGVRRASPAPPPL